MSDRITLRSTHPPHNTITGEVSDFTPSLQSWLDAGWESASTAADPNEVNVEWKWSDGRAKPTEVYTDSAMSQHVGDAFLSLTQDGVRLGIFVTEDEWEKIDAAMRRAIRHRHDLTEAGWT